jgi:penicillin-binding protein 1A
MNTLLRDVVQRGTATKAKSLQRTDLAGKTGTTNDQKDAWFNGFTPHIVGIAWVGRDNSQSLGRFETGGKAALPLWVDFMRYALKDKAEEELVMPEGISKVLIDTEEGLLAREESPTSTWEYFRTKFVPTQYVPFTPEITNNTTGEEQATPEALF